MTEYLLKKASDQLRRQITDVDRYTAIINGDARLGYIDPDVRALYGDRLRALNINHAITAIAPVAQRAQVAGFRTSAGDVVDNRMTGMWAAHDLDRLSSMAQLEAMVTGRCAFMLGTAPDGSLLVTVESPRQVTMLHDPATRLPIAALKRYREDDGSVISAVMTDETIDKYIAEGSAAFTELYDMPMSMPLPVGEHSRLMSSEPNTLGRIPMVMLVNQPRVSNPDGRSDIADIEDILAAVGKLGSDLMTASEASALPHRILTTQGELTGEQAKALQEKLSRTLSAPASAKVGVLSGGAAISEMTTATLNNFDTAIRLLVSQLAAISGLPPYYVSSDAQNPTSADAIRASESRITARVIERQRWWGPAYADLMRLIQLAQDGYADPRLDRIEVLWVDPEPSSIGQEADALSKLLGAGILDRRAALESLGLPPVEVERVLGTLPTDPVIA